MKAVHKDFWMEIRKSKARFLSIFFIVTLGVAFFSGIHASSPDMRLFGDDYYDTSELMDIKVTGTMGLTDEDLTALEEVPGVELAEGAYCADVLTKSGETQKVLHIESINENVNHLMISEGTMPEKSGELFLDQAYAESEGYEVGDTITVKEDEDSDLLLRDTYTVTAIGSSPLYISFDRGNTTMGSGETDGFAYVLQEDFDREVYTQIYLQAHGARNLISYTDSYESLIEMLQEKVEEISDSRCQIRYAQVMDTAQEKLSDAKQELADGKAEAEKELADARKELEDGEKELEDGQKEYDDGVKQLADARKELEDGKKELADAKTELEDGKKQLADAKEEIAEGKRQLAQGKERLSSGWATVRNSQQQLADGKRQLEEGKVQLADGKKQLADAKKTLEEKEEELENGEAQLQVATQELEENRRLLADGRQQCESGLVQVEQGELQAAQGEQDLADARAELEPLQNQLSQLQSQQAELNSQKDQLTAQQAVLQNQQASIQAEIEELENQQATDEILAQINEKKNQLADIEGQLDGLSTSLEEIYTNLEALASPVNELSAAVTQGLQEISAAENTLAAELQQLAAARTQLEAKLSEIQQGEQQAEQGEQEIAASRQQLEQGRRELTSGKNQIKQKEQELAAAEEQINEKEQELNAGEESLNAAIAKLNASQAQIDASEAKIASGEAEIAANEQKLADGEAQIEENEQKLADGEEEIKENEQKLADAKKELEDGKKELEDGWKEYEDGKKEAEEEIADGEKKILEAQEELDDLQVPEWIVSNRNDLPEYSDYGDNAERIRNLGQVFPLIFFLVAALVSLTTMTRMVEERRTQIGTMKALGYGKFAIASKYLFYALLATLGGSVLGVLIGEKVIPYVIITAYGIMYHNMDNNLQIPYELKYALIASAASIICTMGATFFACFKALSETPASLMRPPAPKEGKRVLIERVTFLWKHLNFTWKSTLRNIFRYKKRLFMTIFGIAGSMALLLVGYGIRDSIRGIASRQYEQLQHYDAMVIGDEDATDEEEQELQEFMESRNEILRSSRISLSTVTVPKGKSNLSVYLYVPENLEDFSEDITLRDRVTQKSCELTDEGVVISEKTASLTGVQPGEMLTLNRDNKSYQVKVSAITENYMGHYVYMTPAVYEEIFGEAPDFGSSIFTMKEEYYDDMESVGNAILKYPAALVISYTGSIAEQLDRMLSTLGMVIFVLIISAGMLAFVVLYNLNNINITERQRELATLKVLGFYDGEVSGYVFRENILLTIIGVLAGTVFGFFLHRYVIITVEVDAVMFGRDISLFSYVISALITCGFSCIVNGFMHFKLKKIDMVESLKSVE